MILLKPCHSNNLNVVFKNEGLLLRKINPNLVGNSILLLK